MHEDRLVEQLLAGDDAAVRTVQRWIDSAAFPFRGKLATEWEDLRQEIMVELLEELGVREVPSAGSFRGFVSTLAVHNCLDRLRWQRRWRTTEIEVAELPAPFSNPEPERFFTLRALVGRMPAHCRHLWKLLVAGYSYREMSEMLGIHEGTLRVRVLRCRDRARELRSEMLGEAGVGKAVRS